MMEISALNENNVIIYFSENPSAALIYEIAEFEQKVRAHFSSVIIDTIPSYISLLIHFDLSKISLSDFITQLKGLEKNPLSTAFQNKKKNAIEIPVYYGKEVALDADEMSGYTKLDFAEIIELHTKQTYQVYAIGFSVGFAYLGETAHKIHMPRKKTPRLKIPEKSVAIADGQTAVYPKTSPGGWQIIGRTYLDVIDFKQKNLTLFNVGDKVRFVSISKEEFLDKGGEL